MKRLKVAMHGMFPATTKDFPKLRERTVMDWGDAYRFETKRRIAKVRSEQKGFQRSPIAP